MLASSPAVWRKVYQQPKDGCGFLLSTAKFAPTIILDAVEKVKYFLGTAYNLNQINK